MLVVADNNPVRHIRRPYVNWAIIALCTAIFVLDPPYQVHGFTPEALQDAVYGTGVLTKAGYTPPPTDWASLAWTSVSYIFLHASLLHLAGNMLALWVFGNNMEDSMGHWRYPLFFVLCGVGGAMAEGLFSPDPAVPIVGASGSIAGVMGAYLLLHPRARILVLAAFRIPVLVPASVVVGLTIALDVMAALVPADAGAGQLIAFRAHLGGFVAGCLLILVMRYRDVALFQPAAIYPDRAFGPLGRLMIDLGPRPDAGSAPASTARRVLFGLKTLGFFLAIVVVAELVFAA
jgi:membrane associated rhomboid family serine protease